MHDGDHKTFEVMIQHYH